ncbi:cache domain-containing protein, partial [Clostridium butyricum]
NIKKVHEISLKELNDTIIELKENRLKEIIDRTIQEIDIEREFILEESSKSLQFFSDNIDSVQLDNIDFENKESLKKFFSPYIKLYSKLEILIWNKSSNELIYTNNIKINAKTLENEKQFMDYINGYKVNRYIQKNNNIIALCISDDSIENDVKSRIKDRIRNTNLSSNGYIWINEVLNYNGGDDYAIRLVHPNLVETEGEKLSTNIKDIKGNLPYLTELQGIKKNGEVLYDYYLKKKDSNCISHKLSYAKLYSKYNWIISSGLYLDDLEELISKKNALFRKKIQLQANITIIVAILGLVILGLTFLVLIESKKIRKISLIKQKNDIISHHYNILERKYDKTNQIIHDIKNHLICINALAKYNQSKQIIEYIKSINEDISQLSDIVITNNK